MLNMVGEYRIYTRDTTDYTITYHPSCGNDFHLCSIMWGTHSSIVRWLRVHNARRVAWQFSYDYARPMYQFEAVRVA